MTNSWSVFRNAEFSLRNPVAKQLFNTFVPAYSTPESIQLFLAQTTVSATAVDLEGAPKIVWLRILGYAARAALLRELVETALADSDVAGFHPRFRQCLDADTDLPVPPPVDEPVADESAPRTAETFTYDVALSFAAEDRQYAEQFATAITAGGYRVFHDAYEQNGPWGADLYEHLTRVYHTESRYCVMLVSAHYKDRIWAQDEHRTALERAFRESNEYILPVRIDDTELPGFLSQYGNSDLRHESIPQIVDLLFDKLRTGAAISTVDRDRTAVAGKATPGTSAPAPHTGVVAAPAVTPRSTRRWDAEFRLAATTFDRVGLARLSAEYATELYTLPMLPATVGGVLQTLRQSLCHEEMELVADAALAHDIGSPVVRRQYAQVLVDGGNPAVALRLYLELACDKTVPEHDRAEADGGIGRCYKELFLACREPARRRLYLQCSLDAYLHRYRVDPAKMSYQGINAVALLAVAQRESIPIDGRGARAADLAEDILAVLGADPMPDLWSHATACEAAIALDLPEEALGHAEAFIGGDPQGFTVASFLRQLRVVWQLDTTAQPGSSVLPLLRSALLRYQGGRVLVAAHDVRADRLRVLGSRDMVRVVDADRLRTLRWYRQGLLRCRAVAAVRVGGGVCAGVLVAGWELHPALPRVVVLTIAAGLPESAHASDVEVVFPAVLADHGGPAIVGVTRVWRYDGSPDPGGEIAVLELSARPSAVEPVPLAPSLPAADQERVYVVEQLHEAPEPQFRLQDGALLDRDDAVLRYRTATAPEAPGSPVFDEQWELIGLHRKHITDRARRGHTAGTFDGSEGVTVQALIAQLASSAG